MNYFGLKDKQTISGQTAVARVKTQFVNITTAAVLSSFLALLEAATVSAADVHAIIEIETGYFFGGSENGKWIKPDKAAKSIGKKTSYRFMA